MREVAKSEAGTERLRRELDALKAEVARKDMLLRGVPDLVFVCSPQGVFLDFHARDPAMLRVPPADFLGRNMKDVMPDVSSAPVLSAMARALAQGRVEHVEYSLPVGESLRHYDATITPDGGERILVFVRDVTARVEAEARERSIRHHYEALVESIDGIVWEADAQTFRFTFVSRQAERILGYPARQWLEQPTFWVDHLHPHDRDAAVDYCVAALKQGLPHEFEYRMVAADGREVWLRDIVAVELDGARPVRMRGILVDVTRRREAEQQLRQSEERLRLALHAARMGVWDSDLQAGKVYWSEDVERLFGVPKGAFGGTFEEGMHAVHPDDRPAVEAAARAAIQDSARAAIFSAEFRTARPVDGEVRWLSAHGRVLHDNGVPRRMMGTVLDISERRRLEAQLREAQKMETVGRLAGGVAHDFNNLLTIILGEAQLAYSMLQPGDPLAGTLSAITNASERASQLTGQLLAFARRQMFTLKLADLGQLVRDTERLLQRLLGEDIVVETRIAAELWKVRVDPHQVGQVVMNLAVNAREAMPRGGQLTMEVANDVVGPGHHVVGVPAGEYVRVTVADSGSGMSPELQQHIFEPFFTTKKQGTGLGLATVYGIVRQHGGYITVDSKVGRGTSFHVYLPRSTVESEPEQVRAERRVTSGRETVLLVEDEQQVREMAARGLRSYGFDVLTAGSGEEALALVKEHQGPLHAVVTDVVMPHMSGSELGMRLAKLRPDARVLYASGYTDPDIDRHGGLVPGAALLHKPYTPASLARKLREVLDG